MIDDVQFVDGLYYNEPNENAPDFVKGKLSIQKAKLMAWLEGAETNEKGYINADIKISQGGKPYIAVDNWKPKSNDDVF
jgi:protein tyrosine phosphatase